MAEGFLSRDQKVGLLVGFVLAILTAVLVSEHLSNASNETLDAYALPRGGGDGVPSEDEGWSDAWTKGWSLTDPDQPPDAHPARLAGTGPLPSDPPPPLIIPGIDPGIIDPGIDDLIPGWSGGPEPPTPPADTPTPAPRTYTVVRGDSFSSIARDQLGDRARFRELYELNRDRVRSIDLLPLGTELRLPPDAVVPDAPAPGPSAPSLVPYTVQRGDTLSGIAASRLGTVKRMDDILRANPDVIKDKDRLRVGAVILLPPR